MDGSLPGAGLPPIPNAQPQQFAGGAAGGVMPMRQPVPGNPVGRPAADPEVQEQRVARSHEKKRAETVLPKKATDSKLLVYKSRNGRVPPGGKPVLIVLTSEIEKVVQEANGDSEASEEYIAQKLAEKGHENGHFICQMVDRLGRRIDGIAPFPIEMGDAIDGDEEVVDDEETEIDDDDRGRGGFPGMPFGYPGTPPAYAAPAPPAPPALDMQGVATAMRMERQDEAKRQNESMSMIVMLLQSQQQQAQQQQAAQAQRDEQYRREQAEREERRRQEDREREERAEKRRAEFRQTLLASAPILLPIVEKLFGLNKKEGPDATTLMLMEMVKQRPADSDVLTKMAGVMAEMTKSQMQLQGQGAAAAVETQAKVSNMVIDNLMKTTKELMDNRPASGGDEGVFAQIAKIAAPLLANMQQGQQANPQQAPPPMAIEAPAATAPAQPEQPAAEAPVRPQKRAAPRPQKRNDPSAYSDNDRIAVCIDTLRRLALGEVPADQRWGVIRYIAQWMPPAVLQAVVEGRKDDVLAATIPVVAMHPRLMSWAQVEENQTFVEDAMTDLKALMLRQVTPEHEQAAIRATRTFVERHAQPAAAPAAPAPQATPPAAPAAETNPEAANDAPPATPVEGAKPIPFPNAEGRRRRATKRAPPAAPTGDAPPATPVDDGKGELADPERD